MDQPDYIARNRATWTRSAPDCEESGRRRWSEEPSWGIWDIPESEVGVLPALEGMDVVELGCGTGYVSAWLARRGAAPIGLDPTWAQLVNARKFQEDFDLRFPLICAPAEFVPLRDGSFDLVISEYGAAIWSDPYRWIPEASRLLRPGGELIFLGNSTLMMLFVQDDETQPAEDRLLRDYFGMHRFEWPDDPSVEFHLGYGDWIRLLRRHGFQIEDMIELRPAPDASTSYEFVTLEWARRWPSEEIWKARKLA